jgi:hypothetical protein
MNNQSASEKQRLRADRLRAAGLCPRCGDELPKEWTLIHCQKCRDFKNNQQHRWKSERNSKGLCRYCRGIAVPGRACCAACGKRMSEYQMERRRRRAAAGICVSCGGADVILRPNPDSVQTVCEKCVFKSTAHRTFGTRSRWKDLQDILSSQDGKCPYTGIDLQVGVNASLDHILPKNRYPDLVSEVSNLEWVFNEVNLMKRDMTRDEFLSVIHLISSRLIPATSLSEREVQDLVKDRAFYTKPHAAVVGISLADRVTNAEKRRRKRSMSVEERWPEQPALLDV